MKVNKGEYIMKVNTMDLKNNREVRKSHVEEHIAPVNGLINGNIKMRSIRSPVLSCITL